MTLDSSVLVAVLFSESGYLELVDRMLDAEVLRIGAPTLVETSIVFESRTGRRARKQPKDPSRDPVHELITELGVSIVPFGESEWRYAADAFARYGRGRHKAGLNLGDCMAYASAAAVGDALLFVGDDFKHTDLPKLK